MNIDDIVFASSATHGGAEVRCTAMHKGLMVPEVGVEMPSQVIELQCAAAGLRPQVPQAHIPTGVRDFIPLPPILTVSAAQSPKARGTAARRRDLRHVGCAPFK